MSRSFRARKVGEKVGKFNWIAISQVSCGQSFHEKHEACNLLKVTASLKNWRTEYLKKEQKQTDNNMFFRIFLYVTQQTQE
ncbi:hypothetical protein CW304_03625 [Bacillus sp. UFRGS-B20]|nr:hypothetical protein CW304_03625 [Bacillus sp. UFRGS-B20]